MAEMTGADLARIRAAVLLRDRCVKAAVERMSYRGQRVDESAARTAFDAIEDLIRADEREKIAARPVPKAEAKPSTSDPVPEDVVRAAIAAYVDEEGRFSTSAAIRAAVNVAFRAGRAQAAADIRAAADRFESVGFPLSPLVLDRAAEIAEGSDRTGTDRDEVTLPASTPVPIPRAETDGGTR